MTTQTELKLIPYPPNSAPMRSVGAENRAPHSGSTEQLFSLELIELSINKVLSISPEKLRISNWADEWTIEIPSGQNFKGKSFGIACVRLIQSCPLGVI